MVKLLQLLRCIIGLCRYGFKEPGHVVTHCHAHHGGAPPPAAAGGAAASGHACDAPNCGHVAPTLAALAKHDLIHGAVAGTAAPLYCTVHGDCSFWCNSPEELSRHFREAHVGDRNAAGLFTCSMVGCTYTGMSTYKLYIHVKTVHPRGFFECRFCGTPEEEFETREELHGHVSHCRRKASAKAKQG
jgi:hypothetical protein